MDKINKITNFKKYSTYNEIDKNNKDVIEISQIELDDLSQNEKQKYKFLMTRDKLKVKPPKGPTDHELLLLILSKVNNLEKKVDNLEKKVDNLEKDYREFKNYVLNVFERNNLK